MNQYTDSAPLSQDNSQYLRDIGLEISHRLKWAGDDILKVLYAALEDANYHNENEIVQAMMDALDNDSDCEYALIAVPRPVHQTKHRYFRSKQNNRVRTVESSEMAEHLLSLPTLFEEISYSEWMDNLGKGGSK